MPLAPWWKLTLTSSDPDGFSLMAVELGASGAEINPDGSICAFFQGENTELTQFQDRLILFGVEIQSCEPVEMKNWVQSCAEIWQPVQAGKVSIVPVLENKVPSQKTPYEIRIIPGSGFGTGHHESTRLAIQILQDEQLRQAAPKRGLDLGTGNGILALSATLLYSTKVRAIDNDPVAIENAQENLALNPALAQNISLEVGSYEKIDSDPFDLITANIFAEVLAGYESRFYDSLTVDKPLIMAGITEFHWHIVEAAFQEPRWTQFARIVENGWVGVGYIKCR